MKKIIIILSQIRNIKNNIKIRGLSVGIECYCFLEMRGKLQLAFKENGLFSF